MVYYFYIIVHIYVKCSHFWNFC